MKRIECLGKNVRTYRYANSLVFKFLCLSFHPSDCLNNAAYRPFVPVSTCWENRKPSLARDVAFVHGHHVRRSTNRSFAKPQKHGQTASPKFSANRPTVSNHPPILTPTIRPNLRYQFGPYHVNRSLTAKRSNNTAQGRAAHPGKGIPITREPQRGSTRSMGSWRNHVPITTTASDQWLCGSKGNAGN